MRARAVAVALGLAVDRLVGEPPTRFHAVARFGGAMARLEPHVWSDRRAPGVGYAGLGAGTGVLAGAITEGLLGETIATGVAVWVACAGLALTQAANTVAMHLQRGDLEGARGTLPTLVGRDPEGLGEKEIARAVIESLAENLSDAVVATALWALVAGAPGALAHRAANTLDAMVGYRNERYARFGWASARLDDLLGWPAARATALLVALATPQRAGAIWQAWRADAPAHPSPNAGVAEAAFAAALDLRLGGVNHYGGREEERPQLGSGSIPSAADIGRAVALVRRTTTVLQALLLGVWLVGRLGRSSTTKREARR